MNTGLSVILLRLLMTVRMMNVNAGFSHIHNQVPPIAARTQTATIQMTVCAKQNLAVVANLANNTLSQAGRLTLLYCIRFVFALVHSFRICFIALVLFFLHALLQDLYKQHHQ